MLSAEENPGLFYFMVGIIVLVMAGVGLSLLIDKRLQSSSGANRLQREMQVAEEELQGLKEWHLESSRALAQRGPQLLAASAARLELRHQQEALRQRQSTLEARRRELLSGISALEKDFSRHRADFRRRTWLAATGEKIGTLTLRGDREYHEAVITRVTEVGLEIRHQHGIARVLAADLGPKWQERFQWRDGEP
jgi:chromosome segregation ATPase